MTYFAQSNKIIVMNNKYFSFLDTLNPNYNEDECYVCENFGFVLDGATGLSGENYTNEKTDALWLVKQAKEFLDSIENEDSEYYINERKFFVKFIGKTRLLRHTTAHGNY